MRRAALIFITAGVLVTPAAHAQKGIDCKDGRHILLDPDQLRPQYAGTSATTEIKGPLGTSLQVKVEPKVLQQAGQATQQMAQYIDFLALSYNNCAITQAEYQAALEGLNPVKTDSVQLAAILKSIEGGQKNQAKLLTAALQKYARDSEALKQQKDQLDRIEADVNAILQGRTSVPTPMEYREAAEAAGVRKKYRDIADQAGRDYERAFDLLLKGGFKEAADLLQRSANAVPLPETYLAWAQALGAELRWPEATGVIQQGLDRSDAGKDAKVRLGLRDLNTSALINQRKIAQAIAKGQAVKSAAKEMFGPEDLRLAVTINNLATAYTLGGMGVENGSVGIGDFDNAMAEYKESLRILEARFGADSVATATVLGNLGQLSRQSQPKYECDETCPESVPALTESMDYLARALNAACSGAPERSRTDVPRLLGEIGTTLDAQADYSCALQYFDAAIPLAEAAFDQDNPFLANIYYNAAVAQLNSGQFDRALAYTEKAGKTLETLSPAGRVLVQQNIRMQKDIAAGREKLSEYFAPDQHRACRKPSEFQACSLLARPTGAGNAGAVR
jgi:tetratricopeptide (TPR) repeat protein